MEKRTLTCIICPRGCSLVVDFDEESKVASVSGNICKRGEAYAIAECTTPMRTVTSTVRCEGGEVVPVKTAAQVPKALVFDVMAEINRVLAPNNINVGDVIIENVCGTGVDVIATACK